PSTLMVQRLNLPLRLARSSCLHVPPTTEISTLSLHDALPIYQRAGQDRPLMSRVTAGFVLMTPPDSSSCLFFLFVGADGNHRLVDRKSTRLNSSHVKISYAVFCLKKKKQDDKELRRYNASHQS